MSRLRGPDRGAVVLGLIVLGVGAYYLLVNTFGLNLPELDWDKISPVLVIFLGVAIVLGAWVRMGRGGHGPQGVWSERGLRHAVHAPVAGTVPSHRRVRPAHTGAG